MNISLNLSRAHVVANQIGKIVMRLEHELIQGIEHRVSAFTPVEKAAGEAVAKGAKFLENMELLSRLVGVKDDIRTQLAKKNAEMLVSEKLTSLHSLADSRRLFERLRDNIKVRDMIDMDEIPNKLTLIEQSNGTLSSQFNVNVVSSDYLNTLEKSIQNIDARVAFIKNEINSINANNFIVVDIDEDIAVQVGLIAI